MKDRSRNTTVVKPVKNCGSLSLYKIGRSKNWYYRYWEPSRKGYFKASTATDNYNEALHIAKVAWKQSAIPLAEVVSAELRFSYWADSFLKEQENTIKRGEISPIVQKMDISRLNYVSKFFDKEPIKDISAARLVELRNSLFDTKKDVAATTVRHYMVSTKKVLNHAYLRGAIQSIPLMPKTKASGIESPRCKFTSSEYRKLLAEIKKFEAKDSRYSELYDCVMFLTNTLLRPSEFKSLNFKDCEKRNVGGTEVLWITPTSLKVKSRKYETPSMEGATSAFERMSRRSKGKDSYLFLNEIKDRIKAIQKLGDMFRNVVKQAGLYQTADGKRTLYALRHSGITWRIEQGSSVFDIARWARTSVSMIEKNYARQFEFKERTSELIKPKYTKKNPKA